MRFFTARRLALAALFPVLLLVCVIPGCSNEGEGERCGDIYAPNDGDCSSGLSCVPASELLNSGGSDRCCFADVANDSRCVRASNAATTSSAGSAGSGGSADAGVSGGGGSGGASTGGMDAGDLDAGDSAAAGVGG